MPKKPDSTEVLELRFTKPIEDYRKIKCVLGSGPLPDPCFKVCRLACAEWCERYPEKVCSGCPCQRRHQ